MSWNINRAIGDIPGIINGEETQPIDLCHGEPAQITVQIQVIPIPLENST